MAARDGNKEQNAWFNVPRREKTRENGRATRERALTENALSLVVIANNTLLQTTQKGQGAMTPRPGCKEDPLTKQFMPTTCFHAVGY